MNWSNLVTCTRLQEYRVMYFKKILVAGNHSMVTSKTLSPATLVITRQDHEKGKMMTRTKVTREPYIINFHLTWTACLRSCQSAPFASTESSIISPLTGMVSQLHGDRLITLMVFHQERKGWCFVLTRIDTYSRYRFASPTGSASAETTICGLTGFLIHCHCTFHSTMSFHISLPLIKEFTSQQMKCHNGPIIIKFTCLILFPKILKQLI